MDLPKYQLSAESSLAVFEFVSIGPKGRIKKLVKFSETHLNDVYNLGFGDKIKQSNEIDDLAISNNNDSEKVLATVVSAIYAFTDKNTEAWIYATGSTNARTRLYRMGINKHYDKAMEDFEIYGLKDDQWVNFKKNTDFDAFVIRRLKNRL